MHTVRFFCVCAFCAFAGSVLTGCASHVKPFGSRGYVDLHADREGLMAWFDGTNGLIQSGKADPHQLDNHHKLRGEQEKTERLGLTLKLGGNKNVE